MSRAKCPDPAGIHPHEEIKKDKGREICKKRVHWPIEMSKSSRAKARVPVSVALVQRSDFVERVTVV